MYTTFLKNNGNSKAMNHHKIANEIHQLDDKFNQKYVMAVLPGKYWPHQEIDH
jgi:hypothetical protein